MARQSTSSNDASDDLSKLQDDIEKLRADLSSLTKTMKDLGGSALEDAQNLGAEKLEELRGEIERASGRVRRQGEASIAEVERTIKEKPLLSLLAAFGAGMLITRLMDRR